MKYFPDPDNTVIDLKLTRDEFLLLVEFTKPFVAAYNDNILNGIQLFANTMSGCFIFADKTDFDLHKTAQEMLSKFDLIHNTLTCWTCGKKYADDHVEPELK